MEDHVRRFLKASTVLVSLAAAAAAVLALRRAVAAAVAGNEWACLGALGGLLALACSRLASPPPGALRAAAAAAAIIGLAVVLVLLGDGLLRIAAAFLAAAPETRI